MIKNRNEIPQIKQTIKSGYVKFEATRTTFTAKTFCNYTSTPTSEFEINFCGDGWNPLDDILPALRVYRPKEPNLTSMTTSMHVTFAQYGCMT